MTEDEQLSRSALGRAIEHGETYNHVDHGPVTVTGIWRGTRWVDAVDTTGEQSTIVVRYTPAEDGDWMDELAAPLNEFLEASTDHT